MIVSEVYSSFVSVYLSLDDITKFWHYFYKGLELVHMLKLET
jgi:hypothetical protein